jgi:hypothetical protein
LPKSDGDVLFRESSQITVCSRPQFAAGMQSMLIGAWRRPSEDADAYSLYFATVCQMSADHCRRAGR